MPTLNFTQFSTPTTLKPSTDYLVGYNTLDNNTNLEAKYSFQDLAVDVLPTAGLGTKMHQIKKLARFNHEGSYSMAAITKKEEVICWGQNVKQNPYRNVAGFNQASRNIGANFQFTKFGSGFESFERIPIHTPVMIPFMRGLPTDANQDILNLQEAGLKIEDLIWDQWAAMARLSDGSVWIKSILGPLEHVGFNLSDMPAVPYFSSAFFKITNFNTSDGSPMSAVSIDTLPKCPPICGGLFAALDQNGDLHLWGSTATSSPGYSLWPGDNTKYQQAQPQNITKDYAPDLRNNVREFALRGDFIGLGVEFLQVITKNNKLFSLGYNLNGNLGTADTQTVAGVTSPAPYSAVVWNKSTWVQSKYDNNGIPTFVDNAWKFLDGKFNTWHTGYLSLTSVVDGSNQIYVAGQNEPGLGICLYPAAVGNANGAPAAANIYSSRGISNNQDPYVKGFINNDHTMVVITKLGSVYSAGRNFWGEAGFAQQPAGTTMTRITYKGPWGESNVQTPYFGQPGQLSAIDVYHCKDSVDANITGIKVKNPNGKTQLYLAGNYTFTNQNNNYAKKDAMFRLFPLRENVVDVVFGGEIKTNQWHMILTDTGRTYGVGYGPYGLFGDGNGVWSAASYTYTYTNQVKYRTWWGVWYGYYNTYTWTQWNITNKFAWTPQAFLLF